VLLLHFYDPPLGGWRTRSWGASITAFGVAGGDSMVDYDGVGLAGRADSMFYSLKLLSVELCLLC
jgi:hypothetical protein